MVSARRSVRPLQKHNHAITLRMRLGGSLSYLNLISVPPEEVRLLRDEKKPLSAGREEKLKCQCKGKLTIANYECESLANLQNFSFSYVCFKYQIRLKKGKMSLKSFPL